MSGLARPSRSRGLFDGDAPLGKELLQEALADGLVHEYVDALERHAEVIDDLTTLAREARENTAPPYS